MGTKELQTTKTHTLLTTRHHQPDLYTHKETNNLSPSTDIEECPSIEILTEGGAGSKGVQGLGGASKSTHERARRALACHPVLPRARDTTGKQIPGGVTKKAASRADS